MTQNPEYQAKSGDFRAEDVVPFLVRMVIVTNDRGNGQPQVAVGTLSGAHIRDISGHPRPEAALWPLIYFTDGLVMRLDSHQYPDSKLTIRLARLRQ